MPPEADLIRIRHMAEAAREAIGFAEGHTRAHLDTDRMLARAIVKAIEIVGEAATKVSDDARAALPAVPWPDIIAMRHRLIHTYFDNDNGGLNTLANPWLEKITLPSRFQGPRDLAFTVERMFSRPR